MRRRHHAYADMHNAARRNASNLHIRYTIAILVIGLVVTLVTSVMQELTTSQWTTLASNASIAVMSGLTAINNTLGYPGREQKHAEAKRGHIHAAGMIDVAIAVDEEDSDAHDYTSVLEEIQELHDNLQAMIVIPTWIAVKYPEYEAPWLISDTPPAMRTRYGSIV
jgi:hypothetical protein